MKVLLFGVLVCCQIHVSFIVMVYRPWEAMEDTAGAHRLKSLSSQLVHQASEQAFEN